MDNEWSETKKKFRIGLVISSLIVFVLLIRPGNKIDTSTEKFINEIVILDSKPIFDTETHGKSGTDYFVKLKFKNDDQEYRITGIDYNFLRYEDFLKINPGDTLEISRTSNNIHSLIKDDVDYLNYTKAETNRGLSIYFLGYLFIPMIPICLIVQFIKKRPHYTFNNKSYEVPFDIITILVFITTMIVLSYIMPEFQVIENGKFYK